MSFLLAVGAFVLVLIAATLVASSKRGPETLGLGYGAALPGFIAVAIWARKAPRRWSWLEWIARALLCAVLSGLVIAALVVLGNVLNVSK